MKFLGNLFRSVSKADSDRNDVLVNDNNFGGETVESKKKGFFDRVSEGVSSFVEGIRDRFRNRAMDVIEGESLQDIALQESLDGGVVVTIDEANGVVRSTRWTNSIDDLDRKERGMLRSSSDRINATFERRTGQARRRVSDSIWSEMSKRQAEVNPNPTSSFKMTGTDGSPNAYREGVSAVHSLLSLKYGVSLMAVENAYTDKGRSAESIKLSLLNRMSAVSNQAAADLVEIYADRMFVGGRVQSEVVTDYFDKLLSRGVNKQDLNAIARDTASYAYALIPDVELADSVGVDNVNTGLFAGFDNLESPRPASDSEFEAFSDLHLGILDANKEAEALAGFESLFSSSVIQGSIDNRSDDEIFGEKEEERGSNFVVGESVVRERPRKPAGLQFKEYNLSEGSDSGAEILTLEEFSDQMNGDVVSLSSDGDDLESVRAEYDRKLEKAKDEIRREMAEKFGEVAEELVRQREDLDRLVLDLDETNSIVDSLVFRTLGQTAGLHSDLSTPEVRELDEYLSEGSNRPLRMFRGSTFSVDEFSLGSPFSEVDETLEEPTELVSLVSNNSFAKKPITSVGLRAVDKN